MEYVSSKKTTDSLKGRLEKDSAPPMFSVPSSGTMVMPNMPGSEGSGGRKDQVSDLDAAMRQKFETAFEYDLSGVRAHHNPDRPEEIGAEAYTRSAYIDLAPGLEQHLPHETGHVIQQMQGIVHANASAGGEPFNNSSVPEAQAGRLGVIAIERHEFSGKEICRERASECSTFRQPYPNGAADGCRL